MPASRIQAGKLRHRVSILRANLTQDTFGGWKISDNSVLFANVPAEITTLSGRELEAAQQKVSEVTHRISMRWMPGILAKLNVQWFEERNRLFQIEAIENPDGTRHRLDLLCIERNDSTRKA